MTTSCVSTGAMSTPRRYFLENFKLYHYPTIIDRARRFSPGANPCYTAPPSATKGCEMNCPKCAAEMERVVVEGVEVDRCTKCRGLWFDRGEDEQLRSEADKVDSGTPAAAPKTVAAGAVNCPRCKTRMIEMAVLNHAHIKYESCKVCFGVFFDSGEYKEASSSAWRNVLHHLGLAQLSGHRRCRSGPTAIP